MEEVVMESESAEMSGPSGRLGVAEAWETVTAALVNMLHPGLLLLVDVHANMT